MYDWAKEKQKEIATIKERTIHLNLSDADCKRISTYAAKANITVSQLLESFIGDLVNGTYTNGSDERDSNGKKRIKNVFERSRKSWMQRFCL